MSTGFPLIDMAGQAGDALGRGLLGFQQGREAKRKSRGEEAIAAFAAGDHARALQLAKEADAVQGLAGPLSPPREAPAFKGTMTTQPGAPLGAAPSPRGLAASMPTPGTPTPKFGLGLDLGNAASLPTSLTPPPAEPNMGLAGLAAYQPTAAPVTVEDRSRPDWSDAGNQEALRKFVGAPAPTPTYFELGAGQQRYSQLPGQAPHLVATGPAKEPTPRAPQLRVDEYGDGTVKEVVPGAKFGTRPRPTGPQPRYAVDTPTGRVLPVTPGTSFTPQAPKPTPENREIVERRKAAVLAGQALAREFRWIGTPKIAAGTPDLELDFGMNISPSQLRQLENAAIDMGGFLMEEPGQKPRIILNQGTTLAHIRAKTGAAKPAKLVTDASGVRVPDAPVVKVKDPTAPKPAKPFDAAKAGRSVRAQMGLRASERIRPDRKAEYDRLMAAEQQAHSRSQNGGKTALQMLLEMPD